MGTFLVVCLALSLWAIAGIYCLQAAIGDLRTARRKAQEQRRALAQLRQAEGEQERDSLRATAVRHGHARTAELFGAVTWFALTVGLFVIGIAMLSAVLTGGQVVVLVFGPLFLITAWLIFQNMRRNWRRFSNATPGSRDLTLSRLHYIGMVICLFAGIMILTFGLF